MARSRDPVPIQEQRELCFDSLGICGKPGCSTSLNIQTAVSGALTTIGEMAHIIAAQDDGPRGDSTFPSDQRERYPNLILLCKPCHAVVDNPANYAAFPADAIRSWKKSIKSRRVAAVARSRERPDIEELADLLDHLATATPVFDGCFKRTDPARKIRINGLGLTVAATISRNIFHAQTVSRQIELVEQIKPNYGDMIRARMSAEWLRLEDAKIEGDAAYTALANRLMFGEGGVGSEGVVDIVIAYFFERCTILHHE